MGRPRKYDWDQVWELYNDGLSYDEMVEITGIPLSYLRTLLKRHREKYGLAHRKLPRKKAAQYGNKWQRFRQRYETRLAYERKVLAVEGITAAQLRIINRQATEWLEDNDPLWIKEWNREFRFGSAQNAAPYIQKGRSA